MNVDSMPLVVVETDPGRPDLNVQFATAQVNTECDSSIT